MDEGSRATAPQDGRERVVVAGPAGEPGARVRLVVTDAGPEEGAPVVLLHGFPDSRDSWRHQVRTLAAAGHRVVVPDLRGFGDSDAPGEVDAYRLRLLVDDIVAVMDELSLQRAVVVGHDWGSIVAWSLAATHPDRVRALVAVSVGHPRARAAGGVAQAVRGLYVLVFLVPGLAERLLPWRGWWLYRALAWGGARSGTDPDLARQVTELSRPGRLTAGLSWYRANVTLPSLRPRGRRRPPASGSTGGTGGPRPSLVSCPVMGVWSTDDPVLVERQMTASARFVRGPWRYERLLGVDHWVPVRAPGVLDRLLLDFLRGLPG